MTLFRATLTYGRLLYTRDIRARTYAEAAIRAALLYPRASTITIE